jgi:hypothetical protein
MLSAEQKFRIFRKEFLFFKLKVKGASDKFKNLQRPFFRPRSVEFLNLSCDPVPLRSR